MLTRIAAAHLQKSEIPCPDLDLGVVSFLKMTAEDVAQCLLAERIAFTGFLRAIVGERAIAEDLFQEVTVRGVASAADFKDEQHLRRWFRKVGKHRSIDYLRRAEHKRRVFDADLIDLLEDSAGADEGLFSNGRERCAALEACMQTLTPKCREVIQLRYNEELPGQEVALRLGRKPDTVYKMLARSYAHLRKCIEARLATAEPSCSKGGGG